VDVVAGGEDGAGAGPGGVGGRAGAARRRVLGRDEAGRVRAGAARGRRPAGVRVRKLGGVDRTAAHKRTCGRQRRARHGVVVVGGRRRRDEGVLAGRERGGEGLPGAAVLLRARGRPHVVRARAPRRRCGRAVGGHARRELRGLERGGGGVRAEEAKVWQAGRGQPRRSAARPDTAADPDRSPAACSCVRSAAPFAPSSRNGVGAITFGRRDGVRLSLSVRVCVGGECRGEQAGGHQPRALLLLINVASLDRGPACNTSWNPITPFAVAIPTPARNM
jgi:hypothetical protein